jgi:hypothetical protein
MTPQEFTALRQKLLDIVDKEHQGEDGMSESEFMGLRMAILQGSPKELEEILRQYTPKKD